MTWVDIILLVIFCALLIHGIIIGLVRGVFDIAGIIIAYIVAINFSEAIKIPRFLSFLLIFIIIAIAVSLLGRYVSKLIHVTPLGLIDRLLGGVLGFLKGFVICFVFLVVLLLFQRANRTIGASEIAPWVLRAGLTMSHALPRPWYLWIENVVTRRQLVIFHEDYYFRL
jgi:membrane protein required for colicin V production